MTFIRHPAFACCAMLFCAGASAAAPIGNGNLTQPDAPLAAVDRREIVAALAQQLHARYVFPDKGDALGKELVARAAHGDYDSANTIAGLGKVLDHDLKEIGKDGHFRIDFRPDFDPARSSGDHVPNAEEIAQGREEMMQIAYGIARVQRLPGNVGYIDLRGFGPTEFVGGGYDAALTLLAGTDALVLDLRRNGDGEPESVSYLLSHFFLEGDRRHLNDLYDRPSDSTREYWTASYVPVHYTKPIMVLTSHGTFSGGEECAYDLQTQKRATLVGETTGGGAHPGDDVALGHGLVAFIPTGRAINPITHTDWEAIGVKPDVAVPAADAMKTAYVSLLERRVQDAKNPEEREAAQGVVERANAGKIELPGYEPLRVRH